MACQPTASAVGTQQMLIKIMARSKDGDEQWRREYVDMIVKHVDKVQERIIALRVTV